jgi:hypothetical protein
MRIFNPTFGRPAEFNAETQRTPIDWARDPIVIFTNSKPNSTELLQGMAERMGKRLGRTQPPGFIHKSEAAVGATRELLAEIAGKYRGALVALGD